MTCVLQKQERLLYRMLHKIPDPRRNIQVNSKFLGW